MIGTHRKCTEATTSRILQASTATSPQVHPRKTGFQARAYVDHHGTKRSGRRLVPYSADNRIRSRAIQRSPPRSGLARRCCSMRLPQAAEQGSHAHGNVAIGATNIALHRHTVCLRASLQEARRTDADLMLKVLDVVREDDQNRRR